MSGAGISPQRRRGFTLVEVLLAVTITSVIALAVASLISTLSTAQRRVEARGQRRSLLSSIERRITSDLRSVLPPGGLHAAGLVGESAQRDGGEELLGGDLLKQAQDMDLLQSLTGEASPLEERDKLRLAVLPPPLPFGKEHAEGEGAIWQVEYYIDDDPDTEERGLTRRVTRIRDPATGADPEPAEELSANVVGLNLSFFEGQDTWTETFDSGSSDTLPRCVAVDLVVKDEARGEVFLYRILVAPTTARPSQPIPARGG